MKMMRFLRFVASAIAMCASAAQASPLVTQWSVTDHLTFDPASVQPGGGFPNPVLSNSNQTLSWGDASPQSSLVITNPGAVVSVTNGTPSQVATVTHNNNVIPAGNSLTSVVIDAALHITSSQDPSVNFNSTATFKVLFDETPNGDNPCADGGSLGAGINSGNGCADIFVVLGGLNATSFQDSLFNTYYVSFGANGFGQLSNAACAAAGTAAGCLGFETAEGQSTPANFFINITATPFSVPEPGSVALVGLALASLGWVARRRSMK